MPISSSAIRIHEERGFGGEEQEVFPLARSTHLPCVSIKNTKEMASLGSDLVFGFQQVLFDLIILFFEGLGILDHFLGFLDQVGGTVWVTEPKAL